MRTSAKLFLIASFVTVFAMIYNIYDESTVSVYDTYFVTGIRRQPELIMIYSIAITEIMAIVMLLDYAIVKFLNRK